MVARQGEDGGHEGLRRFGELEVHILQEGLVANAPPAVEGFVAHRPFVGHEVFTAIVVLELSGAGKGHESHGAAFGTVEEGGGVALAIEAVGDAGDGVVGVGREEEGLDEHRYRREDAGHAVDGFPAVAVAMCEREGVGDEGVGKGGVAFVVPAVQVFVVGSDVFPSEALDDDDHYVFLFERGVGGVMDGVKDLCHFGFIGEVVGHLELIEAIGADEGKGCVEHDAGLGGAVTVVVGIGDGDGAHVTGPAASHASHTEGGIGEQGEEGGDGIGFPLQLSVVEAWRDVKSPHAIGQDGCQEEEIPVGKGFLTEDAAEVVFIAELMEYGDGGAAHGVLEVDGIAEVDDQGEGVDNDKHPAAQRVVGGVLLTTDGEEHHHHPENVGIEDGGGVEDDAATQQFEKMGMGEALGKESPVLEEEGQTGHKVDHVGDEKVAEDGHEGVEKLVLFHCSCFKSCDVV